MIAGVEFSVAYTLQISNALTTRRQRLHKDMTALTVLSKNRDKAVVRKGKGIAMPRRSLECLALDSRLVFDIEICSSPLVFSGRITSVGQPLRAVAAGMFRLILTS